MHTIPKWIIHVLNFSNAAYKKLTFLNISLLAIPSTLTPKSLTSPWVSEVLIFHIKQQAKSLCVRLRTEELYGRDTKPFLLIASQNLPVLSMLMKGASEESQTRGEGACTLPEELLLIVNTAQGLSTPFKHPPANSPCLGLKGRPPTSDRHSNCLRQGGLDCLCQPKQQARESAAGSLPLWDNPEGIAGKPCSLSLTVSTCSTRQWEWTFSNLDYRVHPYGNF